MKNSFKIFFSQANSKRFLFASVWFVMGVVFVFVLSTAINEHSKQIITGLEIEIDKSDGIHFINKDKITTLLKEYYQTDDLEMTMGDLNLFELEWVLEEHPYIEEADLFVDSGGTLFVKIDQKYPIIRIIGNGGSNYYLSNLGEKMPASDDFTARVPVVTGKILDNGENYGPIESPIVKDIYEFAQFVQEKPIINALVEQIDVINPNRLEIVSKIGNHQTILGNVKNLEKKFTNLLGFYKGELRSKGWDVCPIIDLTIENQIVCSTN